MSASDNLLSDGRGTKVPSDQNSGSDPDDNL